MKSAAERKKIAYENGFAAGIAGKGMADCPYGSRHHGNSKSRSYWIEGLDDGVMERCKREDASVTEPETKDG